MFYLRSIPIHIPSERALVERFVQTFHLSYQDDIDYCVGIYEDEQPDLIATASLQGNIIRNIAVDPAYQGEGLVAKLISHLFDYGAAQGIFTYDIYTKPEKAPQFTALGFTLLAMAKPYAALLEYGMNGLRHWLSTLQPTLPAGPAAAIVMNANPFTLGHRYLVETAAKKHASVLVFIVEEDRSLIPFSDRLMLARNNLADLPQVTVLPSGPYIISNATFPAYFLKETEALAAQTQLDAALFAQQIAPYLAITDRYVGEEPLDTTTAAYNQALAAILPAAGINLHILPRKQCGHTYISATTVRTAWKQQDWHSLAQLVSPMTLSYLKGTPPSC